MKLTVSIFFFLITAINYSQEKIEQLYGEWQVITADDGNLLVSSLSNEVIISDAFKSNYENGTDLNPVIDLAKELYLNVRYIFKKDGVFNFIIATGDVEVGTYNIDLSNKQLTLTLKNSLNQNTIEVIDYEFVGDLLKLKLNFNDQSIKFVLMKLEK